ncbi:hypothetical protein LCGC14_3046800, partial [marine sediment metagenome]
PHTYLGRSFRHAMLQSIYQIYQSGHWLNKPGHTGTLSTDVSEEDSKDMANIVQSGATQIVIGKKSAEGIVSGFIAEGLNMK